MAYCNKFFLTRVLEAQLLVRRVQKDHPGLRMTEIYRQYIRDTYHISMSTFNRWMGIPAARELSRIEKKNDVCVQ